MSENLVMKVDVRKPKEKYCIESEKLGFVGVSVEKV